MAYSNPTPPPWVPMPSTSNDVTGGVIKPGPMPPIRPPVQDPRATMEARLAEVLRRRAALDRLQPILGGGRGVPKNELPAPTTRGERGGGRFMDGRGTLSEMPIRVPEGGWDRPPGRYEAMPMPAQITPEMVQRWWNGGGQYGNSQQGGIIGEGLRRTAGDRGVGLPPPGYRPQGYVNPDGSVEGPGGFMDGEIARGSMGRPPMQAMLPDRGVNQAPSRPRRPQRPQQQSPNNNANAQAFNEALFTQGGFAAGLPHDLKVLISEAYATGDNTAMNQAIWNDPTIPNDIKYQLSNLGAVGTGGNVMSEDELADILSRLQIPANPYYGGFEP